ncbi:MAG: hypothetical protein M3Q81_01975, partial [bacterium]|nr:hypothetical protein [bacterium]
MRKVIQFLLLVLVGVCIFTGYIWWRWPDQDIHLVFCDVGQGDAILIYHQFTQVLIDAGPDSKVLECLT